MDHSLMGNVQTIEIPPWIEFSVLGVKIVVKFVDI